MMPEFESQIFNIRDEADFQKHALDIFRFQAWKNPVYKDYLLNLAIDPGEIISISDIPFLPVEFFKNHKIYSSSKEPDVVFESSGTSGMETSKHYIANISMYETSFTRALHFFFGDYSETCLLALLPSYLERENSSLVYMMNHLIGESKHPDSGFYLHDLAALSGVLKKRVADRQPTLLIGVTFALLDLADQFPVPCTDNIIIMETGGMKGRREEITRTELHDYLKRAFHLQLIHSEYGMTELLSQAYSKGDGRFHAPPWMKILCRDAYDPLSLLGTGQTGGINIIDLANIYSCSFLATSDLGKVYPDGSFEVIGRYDQSDIRGCNLLVT